MSRNAQFAAAAAKPIDLTEAVRQYRESSTALRRLTQVRPTRNFRTTERAINRHVDVLRTVELSLVLADKVELVGELTEERGLLERLAVAKRAGQLRPELRTRLAARRRAIRLAVQAGV